MTSNYTNWHHKILSIVLRTTNTVSRKLLIIQVQECPSSDFWSYPADESQNVDEFAFVWPSYNDNWTSHNVHQMILDIWNQYSENDSSVHVVESTSQNPTGIARAKNTTAETHHQPPCNPTLTDGAQEGQLMKQHVAHKLLLLSNATIDIWGTGQGGGWTAHE